MSRLRVKRKHQGMYFDRTKDKGRNEGERIFAERWNDINYETARGVSHLAILLDPCGLGKPSKLSERDYQVAATVMQWLGSSVGEHWVRRTLELIDDARKQKKSKGT